MANKLSWNPPKWKSYSFDGANFKVELETGEIFKGKIEKNYITLNEHKEDCLKIFGILLGNSKHHDELSELSQVLDLNLTVGHWPEYHDVKEFTKRYYERVAKIRESFTKSIISIESEVDITPKFTI